MLREAQQSLAIRRHVQPPLDPLTVEYWDAEYGITLVNGEVDSWKGQRLGTVVSAAAAAQRPYYLAAPEFNGNHVVRCFLSPGRGLVSATLNPPIVVAGTRPYTISVYRVRTPLIAGNVWAVLGLGFPPNDDGQLVYHNVTTISQFAAKVYGGTPWYFNGPPSDTLVHVTEVWTDGANLNMRVDNNMSTPVATTTAVIECTVVGIGRSERIASYFGDTDHVFHMICSAKPSEAYLTQLKTWIARYKGTVPQAPPLPASSVEYWHSELQATANVAWVGQLRSIEFRKHFGNVTPGVDTGNFNNRVILKTTESPNSTLITPFAGVSPPLSATGTLPWLYLVGRYVSGPLSTHSDMLGMSDASGNNFVGQMEYPAAPDNLRMHVGSVSATNSAGTDFKPHSYKTWKDGTLLHFQVDATDQSIASAGPIPYPIERLTLGMNYGAFGALGTCSIAFLLVCSAKPTRQEEQALDDWAARYWGVPSNRPPLPASAVEYWHSDIGVTLVGGQVDQWQGQLRGIVLTPYNGASARPAYGIDGTEFGGRSVVQSSVTGMRFLGNSAITPPLTSTGTKPHVYVVARTRTFSGQHQRVIAFPDSVTAMTTNAGSITQDAGMPSTVSGQWYPHTAVVLPASTDTSASRFDTYIDSTGREVIRKNEVSTLSTGTGLTSPGPMSTVQVGGDRGVETADASFAFLLVCSSEITAAELKALDNWSAKHWNGTWGQTPPLPSSAVEYWHSELGASATSAVGQLRGTTLPAIGTPTVSVDTGYFNNRPVYQTVATTAAWGASNLPALVATGARPWHFVIARVRALAPGASPFTAIFTAGTDTNPTDMTRLAARYGVWEPLRYVSSSQEFNLTTQQHDTLPQTFEVEIDATNGLVFTASNAVLSTRNTANAKQGLVSPLAGNFAIGCQPALLSTTTGDCSLAFWLICSAKPSASEITALKLWAERYWGIPSQRPPLPSSAVEYWHSELQCTSTAWVGQIRGTSIPGRNSPTVAPDPGFFKGRVVGQAFNSGSKSWWTNTLSPALPAAGTRPWIYAVGRFRTLAANHAISSFRHNASGTGVWFQTLGTTDWAFYNNGVYARYNGCTSTDQVCLKGWGDGTNASLEVGSVRRTQASTPTFPQDMDYIGLGWNGSLSGDVSLAFTLVCSSKPTAAEEQALDDWAAKYWGVASNRPPLPATAVEYWHSDIGVSLVAGEVSSWTGQLRGIALSPYNAGARPTYIDDGANFNGRSVVKTENANPTFKFLSASSIAPPLAATGTKPHLYVIIRPRDTLAGRFTAFADSLTTATVVPAELVTVSGPNFGAWWYPHTQVNMTGGGATTDPCVVETFIDSAGSIVVRRNNVAAVGSQTGLTCPGPMATAQLGGDRNISVLNTNFAFCLVCSSEITASELVALNDWAQAQWDVPRSFVNILGATLLAEFDARYGSSAGSWMDRRRSVIATAPGTAPTYTADGAFFRGRRVHQCTAAGAVLRNAAPTIWVSADKPYMFWVGRIRTLPASSTYAVRINEGAIDSCALIIDPNVVGVVGGNSATDGAADTNVHAYEVWTDGTNVSLSIDGGTATTIAGGALAANSVALSFGGAADGTLALDSSHALLLCCKAVPSPAQRAELLSTAKYIWGF